MGDHPDLSPPRINCPPGLSETYSGDNSLSDDSGGSEPIRDGLAIGLVANDGFDATNRTCVGIMADARGNRVHMPTEISAAPWCMQKALSCSVTHTRSWLGPYTGVHAHGGGGVTASGRSAALV
jgi:hypothetical protein